jgi:hypothetical protein
MLKRFDNWAKWFRETPNNQMNIPWETPDALTVEERQTISHSMAQFEKGESSDGRHFIEKALVATRRQKDQSYVEALRHFILEENRHSAYLSRFMDHHGIAKVQSHWMDELFRLIRRPGDLSNSIRILVMAEVIAVPYYQSLQACTNSPVLKAICTQVLQDEFLHLQFQGETLGELYQHQSGLRRFFNRHLNRKLMLAACAVVWPTHKPVFRAGGYSFLQFYRECKKIWSEVEETMQAKRDIPESETMPGEGKSVYLFPQAQRSSSMKLTRSKGPVL